MIMDKKLELSSDDETVHDDDVDAPASESSNDTTINSVSHETVYDENGYPKYPQGNLKLMRKEAPTEFRASTHAFHTWYMQEREPHTMTFNGKTYNHLTHMTIIDRSML